MQTAYLNGEFLPLDKARLSPLDRGFLFGDGVYEVAPVYGRRLFAMPRHLSRLRRSLQAIHIAAPADSGGDMDAFLNRLNAAAAALVEKHDFSEQCLYIQISRGESPAQAGVRLRGHTHMPPSPTVFMFCQPLPPPPDSCACVTADDFRWARNDIKSTSLLGAVLLSQNAAAAHCAETILCRDGWAVEGASSNLFIAAGGRLATPPLSPLLLAGVTRDAAIACAAAANIPCEQREIAREELFAADEIFITSSTREICAVTELDGAPVGEGKPGKICAALRAAFAQLKKDGGF